MVGRALLCALIATGCGRISFDAQGDGSVTDPATSPPPKQLAAGFQFSCAVRPSGSLKCWGVDANGELGLGSVMSVGTGSGPFPLPKDAPDVMFPAGSARVAQIDSGANHTCAVMEDGAVFCWGKNDASQLGLVGVSMNIGDNEALSTGTAVSTAGVVAREVATGGMHSCARLSDGTVRCWGSNGNGRLGLGTTTPMVVGDDEQPNTTTAVQFDRPIVEIDARGGHTCARDDQGAVYCWGGKGLGQLGYGPAHPDDIGDDEQPRDVGPVALGGVAVELSCGAAHTCARLDTGAIRCWGTGADGRLGYGPPLGANAVGDDETPMDQGDVPVGPGLRAIHIAAGATHTCALFDGGRIKCWGANDVGQLGYGTAVSSAANVGVTDTPADHDFVPIPPAVDIVAGGDHTCARLATGGVRCWGRGDGGELGNGAVNIGTTDTPNDHTDIEIEGP